MKKRLILSAVILLLIPSLASCAAQKTDLQSGSEKPDSSVNTDISEDETGIPEEPSESSSTEQSDSLESMSAVDIFNDEETLKRLKDQIAKEAQQTDGKINLTYWCSGDDLAFEKQLIHEFTELTGSERYEITIKATVKGEDEAPGALTENRSKGADVFCFTNDQLRQLVDENILHPPGKLFTNSIRNTDSEDAVVSVTLDGEIYAFPKTCDSGYILYYDKRVLSESDVADMETIITRSAESGKSIYYPLDNSYYSTGIFLAAGCDISYKDGKQTADFDSPEGMAAVNAMCMLAKYENGFIGYYPDDYGMNIYVNPAGSYFEDGTLSAIVTGTYNAPVIKKAIGAENVGAAKLPTLTINGEKKQLMAFGGYRMVGVNSAGNYPVTAQALASYLTSTESQKKRYEMRGTLPVSKELAEDELIGMDPAFAAVKAQEPYTVPLLTTTSAKYWACGLGKLWDEIKTSGGDLTEERKHELLAEYEKDVQS